MSPMSLTPYDDTRDAISAAETSGYRQGYADGLRAGRVAGLNDAAWICDNLSARSHGADDCADAIRREIPR